MSALGRRAILQATVWDIVSPRLTTLTSGITEVPIWAGAYRSAMVTAI